MTTARTEFLAGVPAELPILLGVAPFGMIYGGARRSAPDCRAAPRRRCRRSFFAGSLQFVATQLFATGAPGLVLLLTTFIVNLRHMLYSVSLAPYMQKLPAHWKWLLAYLLTDEAYAPTILHYRQGEQNHGDTASLPVGRRARRCRIGVIGFSSVRGWRCGACGRSAPRSASSGRAGSAELGAGLHPGADLHRAR